MRRTVSGLGGWLNSVGRLTPMPLAHASIVVPCGTKRRITEIRVRGSSEGTVASRAP